MRQKIKKEDLTVVLATDCGSTTTKAVLFEKKSDGWHQTFRGEAPTTVEKPVADVTIGAQNAFLEIQELSGRKILNDNAQDGAPFVIRDGNGSNGIDLYVSTSSAGGGLQMIVAGVVKTMTTESAERAALGAGAIVMDAISLDDGREPHERVKKIRHLRPDIVLIAGGTDGGTLQHPIELAETILQADPRPRFGDTLQLPVIYAGNNKAAHEVEELLKTHCTVTTVPNLRPTLEVENLPPARDAIHDLFLEHVMSHAPGYDKLLTWSPVPIIPTPVGVGMVVQTAAANWKKNILAVDIGGATTDVFSVFNPETEGSEARFHRTVSANLGMSYSVANVLLEAGDENIRRWLPYQMSVEELRDRLRNKMIRPTSIPQTIDDLLLEQAVCREALRLALEHHKRLATGLKGKKHKRSINDMFSQAEDADAFNMRALDLIIGSGGVLSHAPDRKSAALMMIDAYEPLGVTHLAVDSIFMMPHLGVFSTVHPEAASEIFIRDCLIPLGTVIGVSGEAKAGSPILKLLLNNQEIEIKAGELKRFELARGQKTEIGLTPLTRYINVGAGPGEMLSVTAEGGEAGLIIDARGRPLVIHPSEDARCQAVREWYQAFDLRCE